MEEDRVRVTLDPEGEAVTEASEVLTGVVDLSVEALPLEVELGV